MYLFTCIILLVTIQKKHIFMIDLYIRKYHLKMYVYLKLARFYKSEKSENEEYEHPLRF